MKILFISRWFPFPTNNGSKIRVFNLLRGLSASHQITLLSFFHPEEKIDLNPPELREFCAEIHAIPWQEFNPSGIKARLAFFNSRPRSVIDTYSREMALRIEELIKGGTFDLIIASQINTAGYAPSFGEIPAIFEEVELAIFQEQLQDAQSMAQRMRAHMMWAKRKNYIRSLLHHFDACTVVSEPEKKLLNAVSPNFKQIKIIPNCMNITEYNMVLAGKTVEKQKNSIIFSGSFTYYVNHEAMVWYVQNVNDLVQEEMPDVQLLITGDHANLPLPPANNITLTGFVDDIRRTIAAAMVSIAPIFHGGGTRLKILEAMALRVPVVATSKGAEGIDIEPGKHCLIADSAPDFADAVLRLLKDPQLRHNVSENGYQLVKERYDWSIVVPRLDELIENLVQSKVVN